MGTRRIGNRPHKVIPTTRNLNESGPSDALTSYRDAE